METRNCRTLEVRMLENEEARSRAAQMFGCENALKPGSWEAPKCGSAEARIRRRIKLECTKLQNNGIVWAPVSAPKPGIIHTNALDS